MEGVWGREGGEVRRQRGRDERVEGERGMREEAEGEKKRMKEGKREG